MTGYGLIFLYNLKA